LHGITDDGRAQLRLFADGQQLALDMPLPPVNTEGIRHNGNEKNEWIVLPCALIAATPVGAKTTHRFVVFATIYRRNVVFPVPAFPVRNKDTAVSSTYLSASSKRLSLMMVSIGFQNQWVSNSFAVSS
jgi:hypothetical protein